MARVDALSGAADAALDAHRQGTSTARPTSLPC